MNIQQRAAINLSKFYAKLAKNDNGIMYATDGGEWISTTDERFYPGILSTLDNYIVNPKKTDIPCDTCLHDSRYKNRENTGKCLNCDDNFSHWNDR